MTSTDAPRPVRAAILLTALVGVTGVLLIVAGIVDLRWWSGSDASRLLGVFGQIQNEYGVPPPALLRRGGDAVALIVLGVACVAIGGLAPIVRRGWSWARTSGVAAGLVTLIVGVVGVGGDAVRPIDLQTYFTSLRAAQLGARIPEIQTLVHPLAYGWLEDLAQGLQVLAAAGMVIALVASAITYPEFFTTRRADTRTPDAWDDAITRIREQNRRDPDDD